MFGVREQMIGRAFGKAPASPAPTGMFGGGGQKKRGTARRIAGYLADFTAGLAGQQGPYGAMLAREQQSADEEAQYQRQRADAYADWQKKQEWERANPTPKTNDTVADYEFIRQNLGDELARKFLENKANPPLWQRGPDGQFYPVAPTQMPTAPVGKLTPLGDGAGNGVGGFR